MQINLDTDIGLYHIRSYNEDFIQINDRKISHSFIITPNVLIEPWEAPRVDQLRIENLMPLLNLNPSIILLGTGRKLVFPSPLLLKKCRGNPAFGLEVMSTPAACRTYIALAAEGRSVLAALLQHHDQ